jgi:hypothetical protein
MNVLFQVELKWAVVDGCFILGGIEMGTVMDGYFISGGIEMGTIVDGCFM